MTVISLRSRSFRRKTKLQRWKPEATDKIRNNNASDTRVPETGQESKQVKGMSFPTVARLSGSETGGWTNEAC